MLQLYEANELTFETNGETLSKAFNAKLTHYLNGEYSLEFYLKQSDPKSKLVEVDKIIFAEGQPFRVVMITPGIKDIHVYAVHVFFDLRDYQVEAVNCDQTNGYTVMQAIFNGAGTNFTYLSDITKLSTMNEEKKNIIEMLQIASERYEGELVRNKFDVRLNNRVGVDTEHIVYVDKNVATAIKEVDVKDVCTRAIIEYGSHDELKRVIVTSPNINLYSHHKTRRYQNITDDIQTEQQAIEWGLAKFSGINRIDVPKVAVEIDLLLDDSLKDLQIGDTVICKIPNLFLDERVKVIGYESDPLKQEKTKLYIGYKPKGLSGTIIGGAVEAIRPEIADVDKELQAEIDNANAAIDKEYNDRVQAVNDAIAKAEADVEKAKEELNQELGQAMTDWDIAFEENKAQVDASIGNVSGILGDYIASNDEVVAEHSVLITDANTAINSMNTDINTAKADISDLFTSTNANAGAIVTVSNDLGALSTTVSEVKTTADSASATATEVKQTAESLSSSVSSLQGTVDTATGDITSMKQDISNVTQTADSISSKVTSLESDNATNKQNISVVTQTAAGLTTKVNSVETTANSALSKATTVEQTASGISQKVTSLETSDGVQNSNISTLQQTASGLTSTVSSHATSISGLETITETHTSQISQTSDKISLIVSDGSTASAVQLTPNAMKFISEEINLFGNVIFNSLVDESTTEILGDKIKTGTIKTSTLLVDKEILVDGTVKAQHFIGGTAELAEITTILFKTEVLQTAWADIGEAFVTKLTADDALLLKLTAKDAFITSVQSIDFQAERIVGGRLRSKNGLLEWNLNDSYLKFTGPSNAMEYTNSGSSAGISFGEVYSSVAGRNVPTVSLYGNQSTNAASNIGLDIMSGEQQINIRADRISFYDHENSTTHGFHIKTTAGDAWNTSIEPWSAGYGEVGKSTKGFYSVNCLTIRRQNEATYSNYDMKENIREIPDIVVREVFNTLKVKEYYYKDETFAYSRDKIKVGLIIEDIAPEGNSEYLLSDGGNFLKSDNVAFMNVRMTQILNAELNEALEMIVDLQQQINELKGA